MKQEMKTVNRSLGPRMPLFQMLSTRIVTALTASVLLVFMAAALTIRSASATRQTSSAASVARSSLVPAATPFIVNSTADTADTAVGDGHCDTDGNLGNGDQCTLRAAIQEGKSTNQGHNISFSLAASSTITLNSGLPAFNQNVTIVGPGSRQLTIQRSTAGGTPNFTIFFFAPINGNFTNSISGLTIANGNNPNSGSTFPQGGCLFNESPVVSTLTDVTFRGCTGTNGGAINNGGTLTLTDSTIDGNTASSAGGGIYNNTLGFNPDGVLNLIRTTVSNNSANAQGGGIANTPGVGPANANSGVVTLTNSTVSGNSTTGSVTAGDGGITNISGTVNLTNTTVTANTAPGTGAGGIGNVSGTINIGNSIVAKNTGGSFDARGAFNSQGYNLIGQSGGNGLNNGVNGDQVGSPGAPIDPRLGSLADNGGLTKTHALLVGSPAIDAGNSPQTTDQRSQSRPVDDPTVANAAGGNASDIGAYEMNAYQVNTLADSDDGACTQLGTGNGCTLREAITAANSNPREITFAPALTAGGPAVIDLLTAIPAINASVRIQGPGASLLTIERSPAGGTPNFRIFRINAGKGLTISGVTVANGSIVGAGAQNLGGNFFNDQGGTLAINSCVVRDAVNGGGISNFAGLLTINNTTISGNGGVPGTSGSAGIYNNVPQNNPAAAPATIIINNSTISGNHGSAIFNTATVGNPASPATVTLNNSTISGNSINDVGSAGIWNGVGVGGTATVTINNCTISGNTNSSGGSGAVGGIYNNAVLSGTNPTNATITITNSTISGNATGSGGSGGIQPNTFSTSPSFIVGIKLRNTIVAGNTAGGAPSDIVSGGVDPSSSFNLIGTGGSGGLSNGVNNNQVNVASPGLGPLANNGGPTLTHALQSTSPALDGGDNCVTQSTHCSDANISQLTTDQRGFSRIVDGPDADATATVDIGAYEGQTPLANLPDTSTNEDTQLTVGFDAGDASTITSVTATSSDSTLVPNDAGHLNASATGSNGSVVINPAANLSGTTNITVTINRTGGGSDVKTFMLTVNAVNDAPTFTRGADPAVNEDAGPQTINNFATNISAGAPDESGQTLTFQITGNTNSALFSAAPAIDSSGTLTFTSVANANGSAVITVALKDNGGTANGGVDTSSQSFTITVNAVNDVPSFTKGGDLTVNEDTGVHTIFWASNISAGATNEAQTLTFQIVNNTNPSLFSVQPSVNSGSGNVNFTSAANANGSATITVNLKDNGGTANGGVDTSPNVTFTIAVTAVNDAPSFTKGANQIVNEDAGAQTVNNWATAISAGGADESTQTLTFQVANNTNPALFSVAPTISPSGTLTYTPAADVSGSATLTINLKDNGGTANGGADTSANQTLFITVNSVNDAPSFNKGADQTVNNNAGAQTVANWATNISSGPANESSQTLTFQVTGNTIPSLFTAPPAVSSTGTLTYTPAANAIGTATITINLKDSGGTANGGVDTSASQSFNITINPAAGFISFASASSNTTESSGSITVTVKRTGTLTQPATVDYVTSADNGLPCSNASGVATPKCDFTTALGTLSFAAGEDTKTISVLISQDAFVEGPETLTVSLSNQTGGSALGTPATSTITIADDSTEPPTNVIDDVRNFVRQHYHDFLNREPDQSGWDFWTNQITSCGSDVQCNEVRRIDVSASFFLSIEFQQTGYLVERFYKTGYGDGTATSTFGGQHQMAVPIVRANEFLADTQRIGRGVVVLTPGWEQLLENNKQTYALEFVQMTRFITAFPTTMTPAQFVDKLSQNAGNVLSPSERTTAINLFGGAADTSNVTARAQAVRQVAEDQDLYNAEFNRAFVLAEYFGYLRRNPNDAPDSDYTGYDFWLTKLNQFNGNYINAEMVKAFLSSIEYRQRFGP